MATWQNMGADSGRVNILNEKQNEINHTKWITLKSSLPLPTCALCHYLHTHWAVLPRNIFNTLKHNRITVNKSSEDSLLIKMCPCGATESGTGAQSESPCGFLADPGLNTNCTSRNESTSPLVQSCRGKNPKTL